MRVQYGTVGFTAVHRAATANGKASYSFATPRRCSAGDGSPYPSSSHAAGFYAPQLIVGCLSPGSATFASALAATRASEGNGEVGGLGGPRAGVAVRCVHSSSPLRPHKYSFVPVFVFALLLMPVGVCHKYILYRISIRIVFVPLARFANMPACTRRDVRALVAAWRVPVRVCAPCCCLVHGIPVFVVEFPAVERQGKQIVRARLTRKHRRSRSAAHTRTQASFRRRSRSQQQHVVRCSAKLGCANLRNRQVLACLG